MDNICVYKIYQNLGFTNRHFENILDTFYRFRGVFRKNGMQIVFLTCLVTFLFTLHNYTEEGGAITTPEKREIPIAKTTKKPTEKSKDVTKTDVSGNQELDAVNQHGTLNFPPKKPIKPYHGHDFFKDKPYTFDKRFKNPCWYEGERLRCLPYFFLLGVRKCATTSLYANIRQHPEAAALGNKEPQFFGYGQMYNQTQGADQMANYIKEFDDGAKKIDAVSRAANNTKFINKMIIGDGSTDSMYVNYDWHQFPGNKDLKEPNCVALDYLHHIVPRAKIIIVFRDPIERLYSEYIFVHGVLFKQPNTNPYSFHKCVEYLVSLYRDCFKHNTVRGCVYNTTIQHTIEPSMILNLGIYYIYMEDILRVFGNERVLALHMEDVSDAKTMERVFDFLEMEKLPPSKIEKIGGRRMLNTRQSKFGGTESMLEATRRLLQDFYKPFNQRMAKLMNDKYFLFEDK